MVSIVLFSCTTNTTYIESGVENKENVVQLSDITEKTVYLEAGDVLKVEIEANPSTGYSWYPQVSSECNLEYVGKSNKEIYEDDRVGDPVISVFEYRSNEAGSCTIEFDYARSWEGESIKTKRLKIVVR